MTNLELQLRFMQRLGVIYENTTDLRTIDVEYYLNQGIRLFVEEWYGLFERSEAARKRLTPLVVETTIQRNTVNPTPSNHTGGEYWTLPADLRYVLQEEVTVSYTDCQNNPATYRAKVRPIKLDYYNMAVDNPFQKPHKEMVWRLDAGAGKHELVKGTDTTQISTYYLTYLKSPAKIELITGSPEATSCEIDGDFHEEIIDKAVLVALDIHKSTNQFRPIN